MDDVWLACLQLFKADTQPSQTALAVVLYHYVGCFKKFVENCQTLRGFEIDLDAAFAAVNVSVAWDVIGTGRIINLAGDSYRIQTNMLDPSALVGVDRKQIDVMLPSKTSMMPAGLLNTLNEDEVRDLMAYLLSRGDRANSMFKK